MKLWASLLLLLLIAACSARVPPAPRNLDDACAIIDAQPGWLKAMQATRDRWGVPVNVQMAVIWQESKFRGDARTPFNYALGVIPMGRDSSAYGYAQAIDSTWNWYLRETGRRGARRDDFADATDFIGWYFDRSTQKLGIPIDSARKQYLAYHDGQTGYRRGSYRRKPWLLRIAKEVDARADMYGEQLAACSGTA